MPTYNQSETLAESTVDLPSSGASVVCAIASGLGAFDRVLIAVYDVAGTGGPGVATFTYEVSTYNPERSEDATRLQGWINISQTWDPSSMTTGRGSITSFDNVGYESVRVVCKLSGATSLDGRVKVSVVGYSEGS